MKKYKCPFEQLLKNVIGNSKLRPRRRTVKVDETGKQGTAIIPYDETEVSISVEDLKEQFNKQKGKSYGLGYHLNPMDIFEGKNNAAMSVDRIDNNKGYVKGNFVITTRFENLGRRTMPIEKYKRFLKRLKADIRGEERNDSIEKFTK